MTLITNNFHDSSYLTRLSANEINKILNTNPDNRGETARQFIYRCRKALCGISGCTCGGEIGERGPQVYDKA